MKRLLFIGNYLSRTRGTINPSEKLIAELDALDAYQVSFSSSYENPIKRNFAKIWASFFFNYDVGLIDFFSGKTFYFHGLCLLIMRFRRKRVILTLHGASLIDRFNQRKAFSRFVLNHAHVITSPSRHLIEGFEKFGYSVVHIPNFIHLSDFPFLPNEKIEGNLVWIRAFHDLYNPIMAIKAVKTLRDRGEVLNLTMFGPDLGMRQECENFIQKNALNEQVFIRGPIMNEEVPRELSKHDLYINSTSFESFGMGVLEAAAVGIPIISTKVGELPMIWREGEEITFVQKNDHNHLAFEIQALISNSDSFLAQSEAARKRAEKFDISLVLKHWLDVIEY